MNKTELVETLAGRLGDRKAATAALDAVLAEIQKAVTKGDKVSITGFGVFEKRVRAPRTARNPRTGEAVKVKKTAVPAFRAGTGFKEMVAAGKAPRAAKASATVARAARKSTAKATPAKATTARGTTARATTARATTATKATARKTAGPARKASAPAKKSTRAATASTRPTTTVSAAATPGRARTARGRKSA